MEAQFGVAVPGASAPKGYATTVPEQPHTQLDQVRIEAERALMRTSLIRERIAKLGERLVGPAPQTAERNVGEAIQQSGFIPGTSMAIDRQHQELSRIEELLSGFEQTV